MAYWSLQWQEVDLGTIFFFVVVVGTHNRRAQGIGQWFGVGTQGLLMFFSVKSRPHNSNVRMSYFDSSINQSVKKSIQYLLKYSRYFLHVVVVGVWSR